MKISIKETLLFIFIFAIGLFAVLPFFRSGFFTFHDSTQVERAYEMGKALKDGEFPVRWVADLGYGYGYPLFNFYAPLPYYAGGVLNSVGFDSLLSTKAAMVFIILLSGISMYFLAREFFGQDGAVVSGVLYLFAPYHALNIYVRGAFSEYFAYALIPFVFLFLYRIYKNPKFMNIAFFSVAFASVAISHNLTAMMISPFVLLFGLILIIKTKKENRKFILGAFVLGLMLSAFYFLPALLEQRFTNIQGLLTGGTDYRNNFVCLNQLWDSPWGFGGSIPGCIDGLSFRLGKLHILLSGLAIILFLYGFIKKKISTEILIVTSISIMLLGISIFLTLSFSKPIWDAIKPMAFFQFPWRFLALATFSSSLLGGTFVYFLKGVFPKSKENIFTFFSIAICLLTVFFYSKLFIPQKYLNVDSSYFENGSHLRWDISKLSDEYMPSDFIKPSENVLSEPSLFVPGGEFKTLETKTNLIEYQVKVPVDTWIRAKIAYFPSWKVSIDGKESSYLDSKRGITFKIPKGEHFVSLSLGETPIERFSDFVSISGIIIILIGIIPWKKKINAKN